MTNDQLEAVADALASVSSAFKEFRRQWHPSQGGVPPFNLLDECLGREALRIRGAGQDALADGLNALRSDVGAMNNG